MGMLEVYSREEIYPNFKVVGDVRIFGESGKHCTDML